MMGVSRSFGTSAIDELDKRTRSHSLIPLHPSQLKMQDACHDADWLSHGEVARGLPRFAPFRTIL